MLDAGGSKHLTRANGLGFFPAPHTLSPGKWLSNPNRSSTRRSSASRCGPSTCRSAWRTGRPSSSTGPISSPPAARMISRKPRCSPISSPTSSAACSATPARRARRHLHPVPRNATSRWTASSPMPCWAASRRTRSNSSSSSKARAPAIRWTARLRAAHVRRGPGLSLRHQSALRLDHRHLHAGDAALSQRLAPAHLRTLRDHPPGQRCRPCSNASSSSSARSASSPSTATATSTNCSAPPNPSGANSPTSSTPSTPTSASGCSRRLCRENSTIAPPEILRCTQKLLDRVLFCAFCEDRGLLPADSLKHAFEHRDPYNPQARLGQFPRPVPRHRCRQCRPEHPRLQWRPLRRRPGAGRPPGAGRGLRPFQGPRRLRLPPRARGGRRGREHRSPLGH